MAFRLGSTGQYNIWPGLYKKPTAAAAGRGIYVTQDHDDVFWAYPGETSQIPQSGFLYRSIFTHGFLAGGYKGSNPWRSVNKTWHANDITFYCGEQLDRPVAYTDGVWGDYNGYVFGGSTGFQGSSTHTSSINLHNGNGRTRGRDQFGAGSAPFAYGTGVYNAGTNASQGDDNPASQSIPYGSSAGTAADDDPRTMDGVGGWELGTSKDAMSCSVNQVGQWGVITGGGDTSTYRLHFVTESMYTGTASGISGNHGTGGYSETHGYHHAGGGAQKYSFTNNSWASINNWQHTNGICKILNTKHGWFYGGTGANVTSGQYKYYYTNDTNASMADKVRALGEENFQMGQDWGYMLGQYDGAQNNHTVKYTYATDTQTQMGPTTQPKGHTGQSSAANFTAAAAITSNTM